MTSYTVKFHLPDDYELIMGKILTENRDIIIHKGKSAFLLENEHYFPNQIMVRISECFICPKLKQMCMKLHKPLYTKCLNNLINSFL